MHKLTKATTPESSGHLAAAMDAHPDVPAGWVDNPICHGVWDVAIALVAKGYTAESSLAAALDCTPGEATMVLALLAIDWPAERALSTVHGAMGGLA